MLRGLCAPAAALMQCYTGARLTRFFTSADRFMKSIEPKRLYQSVASQIVKLIKESKKKVQASIQGESVRVTSKDRDTLQEVIAALKGKDFGIDMTFDNYR